MRVEQTDTPFTGLCTPGQVLRIPIAHGEGNYYADAETLDELEANRQVIFRYTTAAGEVTAAANPNGSAHNIAGICSRQRNVVGLMPHPERACESVLGSGDGKIVLESVVERARRGRSNVRSGRAASEATCRRHGSDGVCRHDGGGRPARVFRRRSRSRSGAERTICDGARRRGRSLDLRDGVRTFLSDLSNPS